MSKLKTRCWDYPGKNKNHNKTVSLKKALQDIEEERARMNSIERFSVHFNDFVSKQTQTKAKKLIRGYQHLYKKHNPKP